MLKSNRRRCNVENIAIFLQWAAVQAVVDEEMAVLDGVDAVDRGVAKA